MRQKLLSKLFFYSDFEKKGYEKVAAFHSINCICKVCCSCKGGVGINVIEPLTNVILLERKNFNCQVYRDHKKRHVEIEFVREIRITIPFLFYRRWYFSLFVVHFFIRYSFSLFVQDNSRLYVILMQRRLLCSSSDCFSSYDFSSLEVNVQKLCRFAIFKWSFYKS